MCEHRRVLDRYDLTPENRFGVLVEVPELNAAVSSLHDGQPSLIELAAEKGQDNLGLLVLTRGEHRLLQRKGVGHDDDPVAPVNQPAEREGQRRVEADELVAPFATL